GKSADARRRGEGADQPSLVLDAELLHALPQALRAMQDGVVRSVRHDEHEFLASVAAYDILAARRHHQVLAHRPQYRVTRRVSQRVVEALELVDVDHHHAERAAAAPRAALLAAKRLFKVPAVVYAGQAVVHRLVPEPAVALRKLLLGPQAFLDFLV